MKEEFRFGEALKARYDLIEQLMLDKAFQSDVENAAKAIVSCLRNNGKVIFFGNGGSATYSEHIVAEFVGRYKMNRPALPAICLNSNIANLTAISNDFSYDTVFARQVEALADPKDIVIGVSTSGSSKNVLQAFKKAAEKNVKTMLLCGEKYNKDSADYIISVPSGDTPLIQEAHLIIGHQLAEFCERCMFDL